MNSFVHFLCSVLVSRIEKSNISFVTSEEKTVVEVAVAVYNRNSETESSVTAQHNIIFDKLNDSTVNFSQCEFQIPLSMLLTFMYIVLFFIDSLS